MTEEEKHGKFSVRLKSYAVILLSLLVIVPSCISIILMIQISGLRSDVKTLQADVQSIKDETLQLTMTDDKVVMNDAGEIGITENMDELSDEEATADIIALENKLVWEELEQDTQGSNSGIRRVYLTFDDGPSSNTDKILDILNEYGVKATFFVCGNERYVEAYQRIVEEGHTLGMHSYSHKFREIYQSPEAFIADMDRLHNYLYEITGEDSRLIRFPGGSSNTICEYDVMQELIDYLTQEEISYFDWNVSSGDAASGYISAEQIARNVLNNVWEYNSVVILMHDAASKDSTVDALPIIIEKILESEDTVLLPITEDTAPIQHVQADD